MYLKIFGILQDKYSKEIDEMIDYNRDYLIDYFGFKTFERAYLFKVNDVIVERPQHMWMRVCDWNSWRYSIIRRDALKLS